jgi:hypothetical protein
MGVSPHSFLGYFVVFIAGVLIGGLGEYYAALFTTAVEPAKPSTPRRMR